MYMSFQEIQACMLAVLEAWKNLEMRSVEIKAQSFQKWSARAPKRSPGASKMEPGASKLAPSQSKINQDGGLDALSHSKRAKQSPGKRPGSAPGSQNGSQEAPGHPQILPK